jgi:hypothetical protein
LSSREEILERLSRWLEAALAEEEPPPGIPAEILSAEEAPEEEAATDWHAMWAAVTALTQEVKLQGRAFKQLSEALAREAERRSRREVLDGLLELRERLVRGLESVRPVEAPPRVFWDRLFPRRWERLRHFIEVVQALEDGYRLTLASLDELLERFNVRPIRCEGQPFDPRRMRAVDVEEAPGFEEGTVLSVYRTGYEWNGEVYRPAQVRVAQRPRSSLNHE